MSGSPTKSIVGRRSPTKSPLNRVPAANPVEGQPQQEENQCDTSTTNILDTSEGILTSQFDEAHHDLLKFKFSRRKEMKINFGALKLLKFVNYFPVLDQPSETYTGRWFFVGPDCRFEWWREVCLIGSGINQYCFLALCNPISTTARLASQHSGPAYIWTSALHPHKGDHQRPWSC